MGVEHVGVEAGPVAGVARDADVVLVKVDQAGGACHTGDRTCFDADVLECHVA